MRGSVRGARRAAFRETATSAAVYPAEVLARARFEAEERRKEHASATEALDACRRDLKALGDDEGAEVLMLSAVFFLLHERCVAEAE